jgi:hypothetical protein
MSLTLFFISCGGAKTDDTEKASSDTTAAATTEPAAPVINTIVTTPQLEIVIMHRVSNFEKWKMAYEANDSMRLANGIHNYVIARGLRDTSMVMVVMKADDLEKAKAHIKNPKLKNVMQKGGVKGSPEFSLVTATWQDTAKIGDVVRSRTTMTVKDWSAWEKNFALGKQERLDNGITDRVYGHLAEDDKKVYLVTAVMDTTKAFAYYTSDALKKRREAGGVTGEPKRFLFRIVKRY